jgi:outer membrane protein TolC
MKTSLYLLIIIIISTLTTYSKPQSNPDTLLQNANLKDCVRYALSHQPSVQKSLLNEKIANQEIKSKLADWFPQLNFNFNFQHNYKLPTSIFQGNPVHFGVINTSSGQFTLSQTIFNRDVLLASSTAHDVRKQAKQITESDKINIIVNVSKAYYSVLLTQNQIDLITQDIARLELSLKDTYAQYKSGVVDKTDYMQATIALNNGKAEKRQDEELLKTSYANLKEQMGYPPNGNLKLNYDMSQMEKDIFIDTAQTLNYKNRVEYQLLETDKSLQKANLNYYVWSFLPSITAIGEYNLNFQNDRLSKLYNQDYPNSYIGLQLSLPIFQGGKRIQQIDEAELQLMQYDYDLTALKLSVNTEYTQALANYKSNLNNYQTQKANLELADNVYKIIELQYKSGIKTYLDVITAETNLRSTQVNYLNALYQVLISKIDLEKALGTIHY